MTTGNPPASRYEVVEPTAARRPIVAHVPHAATLIPASIRAEILLDDDALAQELIRLTDWHVDGLFSWIGEPPLPSRVRSRAIRR